MAYPNKDVFDLLRFMSDKTCVGEINVMIGDYHYVIYNIQHTIKVKTNTELHRKSKEGKFLKTDKLCGILHMKLIGYFTKQSSALRTEILHFLTAFLKFT